MYYRITDEVALRSWTDRGFAYYRKGIRKPLPLPAHLAETMLRCDGEHDIETTPTVMYLVLKGLIEPCGAGEKPSSWSAYHRCDNVCFPMINLMVTGRCNFNCLHCFNAADNAALMTEWSFADLLALLDQAQECGVTSFQLTGGEPMVHPRFLDLVREIYRRDMTVFALNTNGSHLTQEVLDELRSIGCDPEMKISFDGIGFHDWIRRRKGAEESALAAMRLCVENAFRVQANTQVNRKNVHTMLPTARLLDDIGVHAMRLIRTTEVPRWEANAPDACLGLEEYYARMLDFCRAYAASGMGMDIETWQFVGMRPQDRSFYLKPVKFASGSHHNGGYCCNCTHIMAAVTSEGEIVPCNQMSGYLLKLGISLGNLHTTSLRELLSDGAYTRIANMDAQDLAAAGHKCATCPHFSYCGGGCRALGLLFSGETTTRGLTYEDPAKCLFFEGGWYDRVREALDGWTNLSPIDA